MWRAGVVRHAGWRACWNRWKTSDDGWWIVQRIVQPDRERSVRLFTIDQAPKASRPEVGSSRKRTCGPVTSSTPI